MIEQINKDYVSEIFNSLAEYQYKQYLIKRKHNIILYIDDIVDIYGENFNEEIMMGTLKLINFINNNYIAKIKVIIDFQNYNKYREIIEHNIFNNILRKETDEANYTNTFIKMVLGIRANPGTYSKDIIIWIYEKLKERDKLNQEEVLKFLIKSAEMELQKIDIKKEYSRFISLKSMKKALNEL